MGAKGKCVYLDDGTCAIARAFAEREDRSFSWAVRRIILEWEAGKYGDSNSSKKENDRA